MALSECQRQEAERLYAAGWSCGRLASRYHVTYPSIYHMLAKRGVAFRPPCRRNAQVSVNHSAFCIVTDESAYWAGFLMADGCISGRSKKAPQIILSLAVTDIDHVLRFRAFLRSDHKITVQDRRTNPAGLSINSKDTARVAVVSQLMASDLARFGIVPRKTHIAEAVELQNNKHFWRGMVDGDGCINTSIRPYLSLCSASKILVDQFLKYCHSISPLVSLRAIKSMGLWRGVISGRTCVPILRELYGNLSTALPRKKQKAAVLIDRFSAPPRKRGPHRDKCNAER